MEYLDGETLGERLARGKLPFDQVLLYATHIADALDTAHRSGIVHRDLKPGNIMLTSEGAILLDFGLAKPTAVGPLRGLTAVATQSAPLTAQGTILGTLQYMAPEQLEGHDADARSDVFAFGAMVYEMATGRPAFEATSRVGLMAAIAGQDPPPVSSIQPLSPVLLDHLISTSLLKDPDARWQSMADVLIQLRLIADTGAGPLALPTGSRRSAVVGWSAGVACLSIGAVLGALVMSRRGAPEAARFTFEVEGPTQSVGAPLQFALSPNGAHLVSVVGSDKGSVLWLRTLDSQATRTVSGTEGAANPFWSPDNRFIGFFADGKLKTVDLFGAPPQPLCDAPRNAGGTWNRDGVIVFSANTGPLLRVLASGVSRWRSRRSTRRAWKSFTASRAFCRTVSVSSMSPSAASVTTPGVYVGSLASTERTRVLSAGVKAVFSPPEHILFMRDDTLMTQRFDVESLVLSGDPIPVADPVGANIQNSAAGFTVSERGVLAYRSRDARNRLLAIFDRSGAQIGAFGAVGFHRNPAVSADFTRVAVQDGLTSDIWILDRLRGSTSRFTFDRASDNAPVWSRDGQQVAFASNRNGAFDLYHKSANGQGEDELLLQSDRPKTPEDWSADGRLLLYRDQDPRTNSDLWILPMSGVRTPQPVLNTPFEEREGRFSPDGRWIAYVSSEPGTLQVFVQPFPAAGPKWQISTDGGHQPRWRSDGRELFFLSEAREVMAVSITTGTGSLTAGTPQRLFATTAASFAERNSWDAALDGQRFLVNSVPVQRAPITVVVNWLQGLAATAR